MLRWKEVAGAQGYELQIARDSAFVEVVLQTRTQTAGYRWEQLPTGTHWWRVRSFDAEARPSEWSQPRTISVDSVVPLPKSPLDKATFTCGVAVAFELEASPLVAEYVVTLSQSADFAAARELKGKAPVLDGGKLPAGRWFWRSKGVDLRGRTSDEGPVRSLTVRLATPRPRGVADVPLGTPEVTLGWGPVACAKDYLVEAVTDQGERATLKAPQPSLGFKAGAAGEYRWRVAAVDADGASGEFSADSVFRVLLPTPTPKGEEVDLWAELSWAGAAGVGLYRAEIARGDDFARPVTAATVTATKWRSEELTPGPYAWRVSARDPAGHASAWSAPRAFVVRPLAPLDTPRLVSPAADAVLREVHDVDVAWQPVPDAKVYEVELDGAPQPQVRSTTTRLAALPSGMHTVRLRASGPRGRQSPWTAPHDFFVGIPEVARAEVEQREREVRVSLYDVKGRPVEGAAPTVSVQTGTLSAAELRGGRWVARWEPPADNRDVLVVTERRFRLEHPLSPPSVSPLGLGVHLGGVFNGGGVTSPSGTASVLLRPRWLEQRLALEVRGGAYRAAALVPVGPEVVSATAWLLPVSALVEWNQPLGDYRLRGGVGPGLQVAMVEVGTDRETRVAPGLEAVVALGRPLGPGLVELEAGFLWARLDTPLARLNAGGFGVRLGYVWDLPVGANR